ncbi:MAG: hypothetical protein ABIT38_09310 [Gemmatimonadaceae bacterium]
MRHSRQALTLVAISIVVFVGACSRAPRGVSTRPTRPTTPIPPDSLIKIAPESVTITMPVLPGDSLKGIKPDARKTEKPGERCLLDVDGDRSQFIKDPISQKYTTYMGGGVVGRCRDQGITITADSAESYEQSALYFLIGNVHYREKRLSLDSDRLSYFRAEERLLAEGNVKAVLEDSSTMVGSRAEYFRAVRTIRPRPKIVATARPTLTLYEKDSIGRKRGEPVKIVADNIIGESDSLFTSWGRVELDRSDILARGDSMVLDNVRQTSRLMKSPYIESKGKDSFTLKGRVIDLFGRTRQVDKIIAMDSAVAVSKDLTLSSDTIDLRVRENKLQRAFAYGPRGSSAVTKERTVLAESLDVFMPGQRMRELHAVRQAYAESDPDTIKIVSDERDWLRGDTIVAKFDSVATADTTTRPTIRALVSSGNASSYYQLPNNKGAKTKPGLNYVRGRQIVIDFKQKDVQTVTVVDNASGVYLEAQPDSVANAKPTKGRPKRPINGRQPTTPRRPLTGVRRP